MADTANMDPSQQPNGVRPHTNGVGQQDQSAGHETRLRTLSVREALPFTPFSSIVPFNPGKSASTPFIC